MTDTVSSTTAANFIAGEWRPSRSGNTYERRNPWRWAVGIAASGAGSC